MAAGGDWIDFTVEELAKINDDEHFVKTLSSAYNNTLFQLKINHRLAVGDRHDLEVAKYKLGYLMTIVDTIRDRKFSHDLRDQIGDLIKSCESCFGAYTDGRAQMEVGMIFSVVEDAEALVAAVHGKPVRSSSYLSRVMESMYILLRGLRK